MLKSFYILTSISIIGTSSISAEDWVLVRGKNELANPLSYTKIAQTYLRNYKSRIVNDTASVPKATSRMLIGTPQDNHAIKAIASRLGIDINKTSLSYKKKLLPKGTGLVLFTQDPDGGGRLALFTGIDSAAVFNGFTVRVNLDQPGYLIVKKHQIVSKGAVGSSGKTSSPSGVSYRTSQIDIVSLNKFFDTLNDGKGTQESALKIARGLQGFGFVYQAVLGAAPNQSIDLQKHFYGLLTQESSKIRALRVTTKNRNLIREVKDLFDLTVKTLGKAKGPQPVFYLLYGPSNGTNAKAFGPDSQTQRPQILLNLLRLQDQEDFEIAVIHETIHTLQKPYSRTLGDRIVQEGMATYLSQALRKGTSTTKAMMWSAKDQKAAERLENKIIRTIKKLKDSTSIQVQREFLQLGKSPSSIPGAPSRCGYYAGYLAVKKWAEKHAKKDLKKVLKASTEEILGEL